MADGNAVEFGRVRLEVLETAGHTAESISILVFDLERRELARASRVDGQRSRVKAKRPAPTAPSKPDATHTRRLRVSADTAPSAMAT